MNTYPVAVSDATNIFRMMFRIRTFEERVASLYSEKKMRTPTHLGIGQEAVAAGVLYEKSSDDVVFSHHRCHNHFLASGGSMKSLAAELYGKATGCSGGRGGSVHLVDRASGFFGSSAILGESVALAVGAAYGKKTLNQPGVSIVFFGDGALEEGIIWESINFAAIHRLPVLFVCENNLYSTESNLRKRKAEESSFVGRALSFGLGASLVDGNDAMAVRSETQRILCEIRSGKGPYFLEAMTYRWLEHVGPFTDAEMKRDYRSIEEVENWKTKCPIRLIENFLEINLNNFRIEKQNIETDTLIEVDDAFDFAENSDFPTLQSASTKVFST